MDSEKRRLRGKNEALCEALGISYLGLRRAELTIEPGKDPRLVEVRCAQLPSGLAKPTQQQVLDEVSGMSRRRHEDCAEIAGLAGQIAVLQGRVDRLAEALNIDGGAVVVTQPAG